MRAPIAERLESLELLRDSGGPGESRGGLGSQHDPFVRVPAHGFDPLLKGPQPDNVTKEKSQQ